MTDRDGFLQRWSKRKLAEKSPALPPASPVQDVTESVLPAEEPEPFDLSTLPTLEDLTGDSDLSVFLQKGVPDSLKNAALRRVWSLDPFFRDATGPVDYAWDFNDPNSMPGFGPIGPETDVADMLRKIMGEPDPKADAPLGVAEDATAGTADPDFPAQPPVVSVRTGGEAGQFRQEDPPRESIPAGAPGKRIEEAQTAQADRSELQKEKLSENPADSEPYPVRSKRHGGALPL